MIRRALATLICSALLLAASAAGANAQDLDDGAFEPLVQATIHAPTDAQRAKLTATLKAIAKAEKLAIDQGDFDKDNRTVINMDLRKNAQTYFSVSNFDDQETFEVTAFSHEDSAIWKPLWLRILKRLNDVVGADNVIER
jgi:hypothetical protein